MSPLWPSKKTKRIEELEAQVAELQSENDRLRAVINGEPNEMDKAIQTITKLLAGKEAGLAIAILMAIAKLLKQLKAGESPDFSTISRIVFKTLPPDAQAKATEAELAALADAGLVFTRAVIAVTK